jgi:GntR family transcriptional regulator, transcriptional repressor for pyruvate dehydrogenase complex
MLWGIRPVEQQAAYGLAVDGLRRQIHLGLIQPGERLLPERKLAEQVGISRVTLREALRVLETEEYLVVRRGVQGGAFLVDEHALNAIARRRIARDPAQIMRALEFREVNERVAARFAAARRQPPHLRQMQKAIDDLAKAENAGALRRAQTMFHMALAEATQNILLSHALEEAMSVVFLPFETVSAESANSRGQADYAAALAAIEHRDEANAEAAIARRIADDWTRFRALARAH